MPDCQSGAVHSLVCGTIIYIAVAGDIGVCHADCHEGNCRKAMCDKGCGSGRSARLFPEKVTGAGWRIRNGQADRMLLGRRVSWLPHGQRYLVGIHHMGSDRTSYRTRIVLGGEPPRLRRDLSGFWPHSAASAALASTGLRLWTMFVKQSNFGGVAPVDKTIPRWTSVVFHR